MVKFKFSSGLKLGFPVMLCSAYADPNQLKLIIKLKAYTDDKYF